MTCNFTPATGEAATETVGKDQIAQWLIVGNDGLSVSLDGENMATYCTELAKKHDVSKKKTGQFKTTGGSIINVPVASSGQTVDGNKLYEAIAEAINNKKSATVEAVYSEAKEKQVDFVIFPEMTLTGFTLNPETYGEDRKNSPSMAFFREEAKKNHVAICYGLPVYENGIATNHCIILDENGNQLADYAKIHPFSFGAEAKHYTGGNALQLCEVKGVPVAPLICYDLRFPEIFQIVSEQAKVIPVIASWPTARREHWMTLLKARAIENQCFILGVNRSGEGGGLSYIGDSMAVSPTGEVLAHVEGGNGLTIVDIDLNEADAYRKSFPVKADRKPALYHTLWEENIKQK